MMTGYSLLAPTPQTQLTESIPFDHTMVVEPVHTKEDYDRACTQIDGLLDVVGVDEDHPFADMLDKISNQVEAYEKEHFHIQKSKPHEVLRFLMDQHDLKRKDLKNCVPQRQISDILKGRCPISMEMAKKLADRFKVNEALFL